MSLAEAGGGGWEENHRKVVKRDSLPITQSVSTRGLMIMVATMNTAVGELKVVKRVDPKRSHREEKCIFFSFSLLLLIRDDRC